MSEEIKKDFLPTGNYDEDKEQLVEIIELLWQRIIYLEQQLNGGEDNG